MPHAVLGGRMTELILAAVIGGIIALLLDWLLKHRVTQAWKARRLAHAFYEEMDATEFNQVMPGKEVPVRPDTKTAADATGLDILGFTSQTFDTLFGDVVEALPETLVRDLMQYHWKMKFLIDEQTKGPTVLLKKHTSGFVYAEQCWFGLKDRLKDYKEKAIWKLVLRRGETFQPL